MAKYTEEKKAYVLGLMLPPQSVSVAEVSRQTGIGESTLYHWRDLARREAGLPSPGRVQGGDWHSEAKFAVVVETASLNEAERGEYCRKKGLHVAQVAQWRRACMQANGEVKAGGGVDKLTGNEKKRMRYLEKELARKERALAETAALLVLSRKHEALLAKDEDA